MEQKQNNFENQAFSAETLRSEKKNGSFSAETLRPKVTALEKLDFKE